MKRFLYKIFTFVSASMILTACEHFSETGAKIELLSGDTFEFSGEGGSQEIEVSLPCDWNASCEEDWVTITPSSGKVGKVKLTITIDVNESIEQRAASISIGNSEFELFKEITISQKSTTRKLFYTSANNEIVNPYRTDVFGANIISNTYNNGKGVISFDGPITSIGERAFQSCSSLTSVTIGNSVISIGEDAFYYCTSLTSVTIPDSVTSIGYSAFQGCSSLTSVTIPDSVTSIGGYAFSDCTLLTTFYGKYASADNRCLIVNNTLIAAYANASGETYSIPDSVTEIGSGAFHGCTSLTNITIPDSVTEIGGGAFYGCTSLTSVTIPDSVTKIGGSAFQSCSLLTNITIPNSVTTIGNSAFSGCSSLTSVTIGNSVTSIGKRAFCNCSSLTSVTIPDSVTTIGNSAFSGCSSLTSVTIHDSVTSIGAYAFFDCTSLTSVTIPDSVTSIGSYAFCKCTSLKEVYCKPTTPPTAATYSYSHWNAFEYNASGFEIYVPRNSVEAYKSAPYWSRFVWAIEGYDF